MSDNYVRLNHRQSKISEQRIDPLHHLTQALTTRTTIPHRPARDSFDDLRVGETLKVTVVKLHETRIEHAWTIAEEDRRSLAGALQRARPEFKLIIAQLGKDPQASLFCLSAPRRDQRQIGAASMAPVEAPLGGSMSHKNQLHPLEGSAAQLSQRW